MSGQICYDGTWYTLDPPNGAIKARKTLTQYASIQLINGVFYDIADYGMLSVLNPDGSAKWSIQLRGQYPGLADVQKGIMYITTRDSGIYAYSATDGSFLWHYEGYLPQPQSNLIMTVVS